MNFVCMLELRFEIESSAKQFLWSSAKKLRGSYTFIQLYYFLEQANIWEFTNIGFYFNLPVLSKVLIDGQVIYRTNVMKQGTWKNIHYMDQTELWKVNIKMNNTGKVRLENISGIRNYRLLLPLRLKRNVSWILITSWSLRRLFLKVPKLFGPISSTTIPFISWQRRGSKPSIFATL